MKRRKNKQAAFAAFLSAVLLMGTATGCVQLEVKKPSSTTATESQAKASSTTNTESQEKTTESQTKPKETQETPTEIQGKTTESQTKPTESAGGEVKGTALKLTLFSMTCPDGWTINEKSKSDKEKKCSVSMDIMNGEKSQIKLSVLAYTQTAKSYRDDLRNIDIDLYEFVKNNAYPLRNIGGMDMVGTVSHYFGRKESAEMTVEIWATGDTKDPRVEEVLGTIQFTLPDGNNVDPPWPWEGERFSTDQEHTVTVEDKTIKAEYIPFNEPVLAYDTHSGRVELIGNSLFVLLDEKLIEYSIGETLTAAKEVQLPTNKYMELSSDTSGNLYVAGYDPLLTIKDGAVTASHDSVKNAALIDKSGTFGISYFTSKLPQKVTISDGTASVSEWAFIEKEKLDTAGLTKNSMYVFGKDPDTKFNALWIYDKDGNPKMTLGNVKSGQPGSLGSITDVIETDSGFMALDGNARELTLWKADGTLIGEIDTKDIFGTSYPWISTATMGDDGSIYIGLTEDRADKSATEFVVYRLSGF